MMFVTWNWIQVLKSSCDLHIRLSSDAYPECDDLIEQLIEPHPECDDLIEQLIEPHPECDDLIEQLNEPHPECDDLIEQLRRRHEEVEVEDLGPVRAVRRVLYARLFGLVEARDPGDRADVCPRQLTCLHDLNAHLLI